MLVRAADRPSNLVYVAGNIASGKSTTSRLLQRALSARLISEDVAGNPYLSRFYADMARWSFHVDVHFLTARSRAVRPEYQPGGTTAVFDRCYLEGAVFAAVSHAAGLVSDEERATFGLLLDTFGDLLPPPGVLIYLSADPQTLLARVRERGRPYERDMALEYLAALQREYDQWFEAYDQSPKIRVDTRRSDLRRDAGALRSLADAVSSFTSVPPRAAG